MFVCVCSGLPAPMLSGPPVWVRIRGAGSRFALSHASGLSGPFWPSCQSPAAVSVWFWQGCLGRGCQSEGVLFPGEVAGVSGCLRPRPAGTSEEDSLTEAGGRSGYSVSRVPSPACFLSRRGLRRRQFFSLFLPLPLAGAVTGYLFPPWGSSSSHISAPGGGAGWPRWRMRVWQAHVSWVTAPLPMGTAGHECPLPPSPNQQLLLLSHPSGQK